MFVYVVNVHEYKQTDDRLLVFCVFQVSGHGRRLADVASTSMVGATHRDVVAGVFSTLHSDHDEEEHRDDSTGVWTSTAAAQPPPTLAKPVPHSRLTTHIIFLFH